MSLTSLLIRGSRKGRWVWNDVYNELRFESSVKEKKKKKQIEITGFRSINGLTYAALKVDLKFKSTVSDIELMHFQHFLEERNRGRMDSIVTIQDCKTVAIFLCVQRLPNLFYKFYNLLSVNQLLRACIVYIQFYLQTCESIVKTQHYLRGNPVTEKTSAYQAMKEDLDDLRVIIGRFYARIIFSEFSASDISRTDEIMLFEYFLRVSTIVVWIALERKYFNVIKVELERVFRTDYFNNFCKNETGSILHSIKSENLVILNGKIADIDSKKNRAPNRLKSNSPIIHNFLKMDEPKLVMIGRKDFDNLRDERLQFLTNYIFLPETELQQGVSIGILGFHRRLFDSLLHPCSDKVLKLLITGSPMDISENRKKLREYAIKKAQREIEPQSPHIFDDLPQIPRPNQNIEQTESVVEEEIVQKESKEGGVEYEEGEEEEEDDDDDEIFGYYDEQNYENLLDSEV